MLRDGLARFHAHEEQATAKLVDQRFGVDFDAAEFNQLNEIVLLHSGAIFSTLNGAFTWRLFQIQRPVYDLSRRRPLNLIYPILVAR